MRILLIEDDLGTSETIKDELAHSYIVETAATAQAGTDLAYVNEYDLIILDNVLPDSPGTEVCKNLRSSRITTPILMLTADSELDSKVKGLDAGADDYLTKPFNFKELNARIRALLRRHPKTLGSNILSLSDLELDLNKRTVKRGNTQINLRRKEFCLLEYLIRNRGSVLTREMLLDHVWKSDSESLTNTVDVHIKYLRDQIDRKFDKKLIKTIHGIGYKIDS